jgi:hypothetical protein
MEEVIKITASTTDAQKDIQKLQNVLNTVFGQNFAFKGVSTGKDGIAKITYELKGAVYQSEKLAGNIDKVISKASKYKTLSGIGGNLRRTGKTVEMPSVPMPTLPGTYPSQIQKGSHRQTASKTFGIPEGLDSFLNSNYATPEMGKKERENKRINDMLRGANAPPLPKTKVNSAEAFKNAGIDSIGYGDKKFKPSASTKKGESTLDKFNKNMKIATTRVFMFQMGMLGVAFSMQGLIAQINGIITGGLSGLADTEGAIKNMVLSDVFAGTDFLDKINMDEFVDNSLKAQGTLGGLNSILTQMFNKVFSNQETIDKVSSAISLLVEKLTAPEFISALLGIVSAITEKGFIESLTNAAKEIANLINALGKAGLLDKIILLVIACQFLMPLFAGIQLALMILGTVVFIKVIIVILAVIAVVYFVIKAFEDFGKSGDIVRDVINVVLNSFITLVQFMLLIPSLIFSVISAGISTLTKGVLNLSNPFSNSADGLYALKDMVNAGAGAPGQKYDTATHSYTTINFNKPVGQSSQEDVLSALKSYKNISLG